MDSLINTISMIFVVFLAGYVGAVDLIYFIKMKIDMFRWIKLCYAFAGFYWVFMYSYFIFNRDVYYLKESRTLTRIGIVLIMLSLSYGATVRAENAGIFKSIYTCLVNMFAKIKLLFRKLL